MKTIVNVMVPALGIDNEACCRVGLEMIWHLCYLFEAMERRITLMRYAKQEDIAIIGNELIVRAILVTGRHGPLMAGCVALCGRANRHYRMSRMQAAVRIRPMTGSLRNAPRPTGRR